VSFVLLPQVAAALWALLLREAAIPGHLEAVKDYFLLGAGDIFRTFLQEVCRQMLC